MPIRIPLNHHSILRSCLRGHNVSRLSFYRQIRQPARQTWSTFPCLSSRTMSSGPSTATRPVSSTSDPAPPAEGLNPITPGASAAKQNGDAPKEGKEKPGKSKDKKDKKASGGGGGAGLELSTPPEFFAERINIYDEYKAKYDQWVSGKLQLLRYSSVDHLT